jgi:hypothetical protein
LRAGSRRGWLGETAVYYLPRYSDAPRTVLTEDEIRERQKIEEAQQAKQRLEDSERARRRTVRRIRRSGSEGARQLLAIQEFGPYAVGFIVLISVAGRCTGG